MSTAGSGDGGGNLVCSAGVRVLEEGFVWGASESEGMFNGDEDEEVR